MIIKGVNVNSITEDGQSALSEAVLGHNFALVELLVRHDAKIFYEEKDLRDKSPFF